MLPRWYACARNAGCAEESVRRPNPVSTSGRASRSAAATAACPSSAPAHSSQPSCDPAPATGDPSASSAIPSGPHAATARAQRGGARRPVAGRIEPGERVERRDGDGLAVGVGERRARRAAVRAHDARALGVVLDRRHRVAPALLRQAAALARAVADVAAARVERASQPAAGRPPRRLELGAPARRPRAGRARRGTSSSRPPSRSTGAGRRAPASRARRTTARPRGGTRAGSCPAPPRSPGRASCPGARRARAGWRARRPAPPAAPGAR